MRDQILWIFIAILLVGCQKEPIEVDEYADCRTTVELNNSKADTKTGLIEFDIIPDKSYTTKGAVLTSKDRLWPDATIPYYFQPTTPHSSGGSIMGFNREEDKDKIRAAIRELEMETGLKIIEYQSRESLLLMHKDGVRIIPGIFNSSAHKGRQGGIQPIHLAFDLNPRTIKHEFLHTVGFGHEFQRADRDEYVEVLYDNMIEHWHRQFDIDPLTVDCGKFDINSVMMYGSYQIKTEGDKPIMLTVDGE